MRYLICFLVLFFSSCGSSQMDYAEYEATSKLPNESHQLASPQEKSAEGTPSKQSGPDKSRRIVFEADVELIVDDFSPAEQKLRSLVTSFDGYMANVKVKRVPSHNAQRSGTWTARIPVENFEEFLKAARELGTTATITQDARDVTMEYVDLDSRIANKKKLEGRISELLGSSRGSVQELIKIEHELARIREGIEVMEGRLRKLKDLSAVTTVSITMIEKKPEPVVAVVVPPVPLTFSQRMDKAWSNSVDSARKIYEDLFVWLAGNLIAVVAWLTSLLIVLSIARLVYKYFWLATRPVRA